MAGRDSRVHWASLSCEDLQIHTGNNSHAICHHDLDKIRFHDLEEVNRDDGEDDDGAVGRKTGAPLDSETLPLMPRRSQESGAGDEGVTPKNLATGAAALGISAAATASGSFPQTVAWLGGDQTDCERSFTRVESTDCRLDNL